MHSNPLFRMVPLALVLGATAMVLSACKIERKPEAGSAAQPSAAGSFENKSFDPKGEVEAMWISKVVPTIDKMAGDYPALRLALQKNLDEAGARYGYREKGDNGPWSMATRVAGKVVAAETELSAGTADIDVDGDGQADVQVQIGPVIRGTAIRDTLPFISFTHYANQIDYAQLANAFNDRAYEGALKDVDRASLLGKQVELTGVFNADPGEDLPVVTVIAFKVVTP